MSCSKNGSRAATTSKPSILRRSILPGNPSNRVNLRSRVAVLVAILSSTSFDATTVDPDTVTLSSAPIKNRGRSGGPATKTKDVNGDGLADLVVDVTARAMDLTASDTEAMLEGATFSGVSIRGVDAVTVVGPPEGRQ